MGQLALLVLHLAQPSLGPIMQLLKHFYVYVIMPSLEKNHISALWENFIYLVGNFVDINMKSLNAKFQPFIFQTEGGVWRDGQTDDIFFLSDPLCKVIRYFRVIFPTPLACLALSWR